MYGFLSDLGFIKIFAKVHLNGIQDFLFMAI